MAKQIANVFLMPKLMKDDRFVDLVAIDKTYEIVHELENQAAEIRSKLIELGIYCCHCGDTKPPNLFVPVFAGCGDKPMMRCNDCDKSFRQDTAYRCDKKFREKSNV